MLTHQTLADFAEQTAAREPTPGGGSVSAYLGALGAALGAMAARFTEGRKGFEEHAAALAGEIAALDELRARLLELVNEDAEAYGKVTAAYGLPRGTDDEKVARRGAIQAALVAAMQPPLDACRTAVQALEVLDGLRSHVNSHLASDVAVGAYARAAGFRGSSINVLVNLAGIKDQQIREQVSEEGAQLAERASALEATISQAVVTALQASS